MKDSRELRKTLATILVAGLGAVVAQKLLEPTVKRTLKVKR